MYSRNCSTRVGTISVAHAVFASSSSRLAKTIEGTLEGNGNGIVLDLSHSYDEFLEFSAHVDGTDGHANTVEVYAARGKSDDYVHVATIVATAGTGIVRGSARLWIDTAAVTEVQKSFEVVSGNGTGANEPATVWLNTNGYSRFLFVASTLASTDLVIEFASVGRASIPSVA